MDEEVRKAPEGTISNILSDIRLSSFGRWITIEDVSAALHKYLDEQPQPRTTEDVRKLLTHPAYLHLKSQIETGDYRRYVRQSEVGVSKQAIHELMEAISALQTNPSAKGEL